MESYLSKIKRVIGQDLKGEVKTFENLTSHFSMQTKASNEDISNCDNFFHSKLPDDYKVFLEYYNGGILFQIEDFIGYDFLGTEQLIRQNSSQKNSFGEDWDNNIILFCRCLGDAEYMGFKVSETHNYEIVHCFMDEWPEKWKVLKCNFKEFINLLIDEEGKEFWYDENIQT